MSTFLTSLISTLFIIAHRIECSHVSHGIDQAVVNDIFGNAGFAGYGIDGVDDDILADIIGDPLVDAGGEGRELSCEQFRSCVEGVYFSQYWKNYKSAYECENKCKHITFETFKVDVDTVCPNLCSPVCGLDGKTYSNFCELDANGVAKHCDGQCPCPEPACTFHGELDGDSICPPYQFAVNTGLDGTQSISVYRAPCLGRDIEVNNLGVWKGEVVTEDGVDFADGYGVLQYQAEDIFNREKYEGMMAKGKREGHGSLYWKDGSHYSGEWKEDKKDGEGTIFYANGDVYEGFWKGEMKFGEGTYHYTSGGTYSGNFEDGSKHGQGKNSMVMQGGSVEDFQGEYVNNIRSNGVYSSEGHTYEGEFCRDTGLFSGQGVYTWSCGKIYQGGFLQGKPHGHGVMTFPEGWSYEGDFKNGKFNGQGKFIWTQNNYYEGTFKNGQMTGVGDYYFENGGLFVGTLNLYYPDRHDKSFSQEATFDGKVVKVKKQEDYTDVSGYARNKNYGRR